MPAPQGFVSDFKCCTGSVMAPTECKTIGFCFVWFSVSVFSLCTVSHHDSIHLSKTAFSWNALEHLFELDCGFHGYLYFLLKCSDWPNLGRLDLTETTHSNSCSDSVLHTQSQMLSAACRPQSHLPWHSTDSAVSQQLAHIR